MSFKKLGRRTMLFAMAWVCIGMIAPAEAGEKDFKSDARLVGSWEVSWVRSSGDKHHRFANVEAFDFSSTGTLGTAENRRYAGGTYALTVSTTPRGIDLARSLIDEKTARAIYRFDGENLILCVNTTSDARPTDFDLPPGSDRLVLVLQRSRVKHRNKDEAAKLVAEFKAHADDFEITIARHGYGSEKIDLHSITLHSSNRRFEPSAIGPSGKPVFKSARITKEQAIKIMDALEGWPAHFFRTAQDAAEPLRDRTPYFSTRIGYGPDSKPGPQLHLAQDRGWHTLAQFAVLGNSVDGDAAKLLGEIQGAIRSDPDTPKPVKAKEAKNVNVLLVNGKASADRFKTATEYLSLALNPYRNMPDAAKVRPRIISAAQIDDPDFQKNLKDWDCIFLCGLRQVGPAAAKALEAHVRAGGGLVICLGPDVDLESYNTNLYRQGKGLLPTKLLGEREPKKDHVFHFAVADEAFKEPPLTAFNNQADRLTLFTPMFRKFIHVGELGPESKARIIASFDETPLVKGGKPSRAGIAMLEWRPFADGKDKTGGRVVLFTTTVNMDWNSWPGSPSFPALTHEMLQLVSADRPMKKDGKPR